MPGDYISRVVDEMEKLVKADIDHLVDYFGQTPGREKVPGREAMRDYDALTDDDIAKLAQTKGVEAVGAYIVEMERRKRRSRRMRNAIH